ncbi:PREDICTED: RNA-binding protein 12B-B-like [Nanorana parkeri]|uniref:RNA-binding protein 12B-B-like n=1 Tax=Nanorana parkeri TaxID=125878 RepID=UPI000854E0C6|nr:PREDICTED: RNA-binding protein 12B-B-like [Nanorana parkeri]
MSVTLRLQGLSNRANSYDIRKFFVGLDIPQGGVHIIGGSDGEAFVDVATWDNAYEALQMSGLKIRDSVIQISVVSSEEKQQALENCDKVKDSAHGRNGTHEKKSNKGRDARSRRNISHLRVDINDFEPTPSDIRHFFKGIYIRDIVFSKDEDSPGNVIVIIMFGNRADATEGYNRYKDSKILRIMWSSESEWIKYGGRLDDDEDDCNSSTSKNSRRRTHSRSARRRSRSPRRRSRSPRRYTRSPLSSSRTPSQSEEQDSTNTEEYHVRLMNLSYRAKRDDIKKLFHNQVRDDHIVFVYDEKGHRTREGFATFTREEHYRKALTLNRVMLKGYKLYISLISKSDMQRSLSSKGQSSGNFQAYLYLRNFSPDVTKSDVKEFFVDFPLSDDDIFLLLDKNNTCLGDVLVKLSSLEETFGAEKLDGTTFKDSRISLKVIYENKLTSFLQSNGLHKMPPDLNECVTQEDDPSEDEVTQENDTPDDEPIIQDLDTPEDDSAVQKDSPPECVSQADD